MGPIGVEPTGEITPCESKLTSIGSLSTRSFGELTEEGKQMTAGQAEAGDTVPKLPAGATSHAEDLPLGVVFGVWSAPDPYRAGGAVAPHRVPRGAFGEA